jgi:hypothetical protein
MDITRSPCSWGTWFSRLEAGLKADDFALLKMIVAKSKEVKTEWIISGHL